MCLAVPGKIIEIYQKQGGDYAVIHVGFAISLLSEEEALQSIELLREILEAGEELGDETSS